MPQYQVSHTLVPGALEAASVGVPPVMYQPRNPYASAAYVASGNGVSPLVGYPSQYPHVIHYTPRPVPASIYEPIPTYADAMSLVRALSPAEPPRSVIGSIPSPRAGSAAPASAAKPASSQPATSKPTEPAPKTAPAQQPAPEFNPNPDNAGGGGGGGGVGPEPAGAAMPNLFRGYVNPDYAATAPSAPRLQEILTMPFSEWPDAFSRWWNNRDTPSSAFAEGAAPSSRNSSYWDTMDAQNTARRSLGLDEVAGPSRPANPAAQRPAIPTELTTPPDLMAQLQAQGTVVPQDVLPPEVIPTVTELAAPAPYKPRDVLPPEVQIRAVQAPTRAPVGQSNGAIPAPVYRNNNAPADTTPTVLAAPSPVDVLGPVPEWYRSPAIRQYDRPNVSDDPGSDLPFGVGSAADFYYSKLRPGYQENVVPVVDAAGDTLAAAARTGSELAAQAYNNLNKSLNEYWAQFFANQFAKRGPLEGQNLQDYLTQAQNLGFYDEALQYLGR